MQSDPRHGRATGVIGRYVLVCIGVTFATWIELIFARTQAAPLSLFAFCIAIALSAALGGFGPGLFALLLSALAIDFFIIVPGGLLDFQTSTDALVFVAFCAGWLAYCVISSGPHGGSIAIAIVASKRSAPPRRLIASPRSRPRYRTRGVRPRWSRRRCRSRSMRSRRTPR